jgi:hypothetical protein
MREGWEMWERGPKVWITSNDHRPWMSSWLRASSLRCFWRPTSIVRAGKLASTIHSPLATEPYLRGPREGLSGALWMDAW